jgi:RNA polymerase sigma-70 factor (ECF subfamily)
VGPLKSDREAHFRALYADTHGDVLRFAQRRVHNSNAEDVAADAFLVAWRRLGDAPSGPDDLRAWLFGIARNCILNTVRGQGRRDALAVRVAETTLPDGLAYGHDADLIAQRIDLAAAWRCLSETEQEALSLAVFEDLTSPQAGRVLGITAASYRLRLLRARRALRRQLDLADSSSCLQMETQS